ncbi:caspase family protein [Amycolatopsis sp. WQ 127309]|uniref:caspase family protein n=1 Tax=Amycolatopsis sp. WQ 127309 TaxID=2932773 RepID=UPI001FF612D2|nr:caspase family protein [Amycolatopsis sp. WQ 127309]UOZ10779.1 caspase family protein [Amycolatopsis sp. WQ 127309]
MAGRRRALIVANGEYDNAGLQRLGSPAADADALAGVLSDRAISDFEVRVVRNETAHVVQAEVEDLCAEGRPDDVLLLHFSCHGLKDDSGQLFFAARNTRPDRLRSTAVPAHFVQQCLKQSRSRSVVLLLDCCYGGAFGQGVAVRASGDANVLDSFRGGRGRAVITASNSIEYAFEGARLAEGGVAQPSVFTSALVEGLRTGEADRDEDGWIALGELYEYLFDRVRERNPKQTPSRDIEMQGELYLARSRRRRVKPSPVPADLAAAIAAENPFTRLGAVAELRRRLTSANLEVAVGAFEALEAMSSTDVQHVAEAAQEALGRAAVRVDPPEVRLAAAPGSVVIEAVRASGPPVAREVRFEASHAWIGIVETAGGAELSVTAGESGVRRGKVVVTGLTGETVVAVEIETVPEPAVVPEPGSRVAAEVVAEPEPVAGVVAEPEPVVAEPEPLVDDLRPRAAPGPVTEPAVGAEPGPEVVAEPAVAVETVADPEPVVAEAEPVAGPEEPAARDRPTPAGNPPGTVDPVAGAAAILAIGGAIFAVAGFSLDYRYDYSLAQYRPGMVDYAAIVMGCALVAGILTLAPRTRHLIGPAALLGVGFAGLFGFLRFFGEFVTLSARDSTELRAGYVFELLAHGALVVAAVFALVALRRDAGGGFGRARGWEPWVAIVLGVTVAVGWIIQLGELISYDESEAGRAQAYFVLGAVLVVALPVFAAFLRPPAAGCAVLAAGTLGLVGVLAPVSVSVEEYSSFSYAGQTAAVAGLALLVVDSVVLAVRLRRNQPIGRQP